MSRDLPDPTPEEVKYVLQQAILRNYPNPERKGCPGSPALKRAAEQRLPFEDSDWEHTSHCFPCYSEFLEYRHEFLDQTARAKRRSRIVGVGVLASFYYGRCSLLDPPQPRFAASASACRKSDINTGATISSARAAGIDRSLKS